MAKVKVGICAECGKEKKFKGRGLCTACFNEKYNTRACEKCGEVKVIIGREMCSKCYNRVLTAEKKKGIWKKVTKKDMQIEKKEKKKSSSSNVGFCIFCDKEKNIYRNEMCTNCYKFFYKPVRRCEGCGELKRILAKELCDACYRKTKT